MDDYGARRIPAYHVPMIRMSDAALTPPARLSHIRLVFRAIEFSVLFLGVPLASVFVARSFRGDDAWLLAGAMPLALAVTASFAALLALWVDPTFNLRRLGVANATRGDVRSVLALAGGAALGMTLAVAAVRPAWLFWFPRHHSGLWVLFLIFYPLLSVYPQELVYRAFFFHRYRPLFGAGRVMVAANAIAFGYLHVIFANPMAVLLASIGGVVFAYRYDRTRSLLLVTFEHGLYGILLITIGLGPYFYTGPKEWIGG